MPLLRPAIATVAVFTIVPIWNDLWFPLILTSSESTHTITLGVQQFLGQYITDWNACWRPSRSPSCRLWRSISCSHAN